MKHLILALAIILTSQSAFASFYGPLLTLEKFPGYTMASDAEMLKCEIYPDKLVITRTIADLLESKEVRNVKVDDTKLFEQIQLASQGEIEKEDTMMVDGPSSIYTAIRIMPNCGVEKVELFQDGRIKVLNKSSAARALVNFLNMHCK